VATSLPSKSSSDATGDGLRKAIAMRIDRRLAARSMLRMSFRTPTWKPSGGCPIISGRKKCLFYLWLLWIAREKVLALHRRHLGAEKRAVTREAPLLPVDSSATFVSFRNRGARAESEPGTCKTELAGASAAWRLGQLDNDERDLILWRHFEQLSARDMAQLLQISERLQPGKRYIRAVERFCAQFLVGLGVSGPGQLT